MGLPTIGTLAMVATVALTVGIVFTMPAIVVAGLRGRVRRAGVLTSALVVMVVCALGGALLVAVAAPPIGHLYG